MKKPNIVFYFSDQQRADTLGCYGQELPISPIADRLAKEGVRFDLAFTPQPVCGPCRSVFQSGLYPTTTGCYINNKMLPLETDTVAKILERNGYETAYVGKWHLATEGELEKPGKINHQTVAVPMEYRGGYTGFWRAADCLELTSHGYGGYIFDENNNKIDFEGYRTDCITDFALEFLDNYRKEEPFFLTVSHIEPHHQNDANHYQGPKGSAQRFANYKVPGDLAAFEDGDWKEEFPDYLGGCNAIDVNLGRIIDKLTEKGLYEDTIIIFTSDHGSHFRTRNKDRHFNGFDDYKRTCHDSALRVPLIIRGGAFLGGKIVEQLVSTASIPRTILSAASVTVPETYVGEDLALVADGHADRKNEVFAQISESRVGRVIRTEKYKYAVCAPDKNGGLYKDSDVYVDDFLYDLTVDPYELDNLVEDSAYAEIKEQLRDELLSWIESVEGYRPAIR
ncbi:MAG: sulfatase-like hydrolase/transferase [Sphaerochaetaceae bacterium]|nr:sulfatase-like hydrolase/transferase [Sphaerochaetaceae bacterium]